MTGPMTDMAVTPTALALNIPVHESIALNVLSACFQPSDPVPRAVADLVQSALRGLPRVPPVVIDGLSLQREPRQPAFNAHILLQRSIALPMPSAAPRAFTRRT